MTKHRVFFSFHYKPDCWRAAQVRNMGVLEGNQPVSDNEWEGIAGAGEIAIKRWIDAQMKSRSCVVVLIGSQTAHRKWVRYELEKAWRDGKGVVGIYVHNLEDRLGLQSVEGRNPFSLVSGANGTLDSVVQVHNPPQADSKQAYRYIAANLGRWVADAIALRHRYRA